MADREQNSDDETKGWTGDAEARDSDGDDRQELAEARTQMAEDRTILANERTFAGWMRTGMAAVGIGLAFNALFVSMQPWWVPRAIATAFFLLSIYVTVSAEQRACAVIARLHSHRVKTVAVSRLKWISWGMALSVSALIAALWTLPVS